MLPALPILVFGTLFIMWSRTSLAPVKELPPKDNSADGNDNKIIVKVVAADEAA